MENYTKISYDSSKFDLKRKKSGLWLYLKGVRKPIFNYDDVENLELNQLTYSSETYFVSIDGPRCKRTLCVIKVSEDGKIIDQVKKEAMDIKRIASGVYLLDNLDWGCELYYVNGNKSFDFDKVYSRETSMNLIDGAPILVEKEYKRYCVSDTIIYGICPSTKEVVTNIYSILQKEYISVPSWVKLDDGLDDLISSRIIEPLREQEDRSKLNDRVLDKIGRVNKEFVKSLKR